MLQKLKLYTSVVKKRLLMPSSLQEEDMHKMLQECEVFYRLFSNTMAFVSGFLNPSLSRASVMGGWLHVKP